jgi:hypothetical protein
MDFAEETHLQLFDDINWGCMKSLSLVECQAYEFIFEHLMTRRDFDVTLEHLTVENAHAGNKTHSTTSTSSEHDPRAGELYSLHLQRLATKSAEDARTTLHDGNSLSHLRRSKHQRYTTPPDPCLPVVPKSEAHSSLQRHVHIALAPRTPRQLHANVRPGGISRSHRSSGDNKCDVSASRAVRCQSPATKLWPEEFRNKNQPNPRSVRPHNTRHLSSKRILCCVQTANTDEKKDSHEDNPEEE